MQKNEHKTDAFLKKFYNNSLKLSDLLNIEYDEASPFKLIEEKKDYRIFKIIDKVSKENKYFLVLKSPLGSIFEIKYNENIINPGIGEKIILDIRL